MSGHEVHLDESLLYDYAVMTFSAFGSTSKRTGVVPIGWPSTCTDKRFADEISTRVAANISILGL